VNAYLLLSTYHYAGLSERVGLQYFIGDFDGRSFYNENPATTVLTPDYGRDNYALVTWSNLPERDGRCLAIGWMSDWAYARNTPTDVWKGAMTSRASCACVVLPRGSG
jgi:sucrose-6-phosphate hydrolase SacC (GH32 family)